MILPVTFETQNFLERVQSSYKIIIKREDLAVLLHFMMHNFVLYFKVAY